MRGLKVIRVFTLYNTTSEVEGYYMLDSCYADIDDMFYDESGCVIEVTDIKEIVVSIVQEELLSSVQYGINPYREVKVSCIKTDHILEVDDTIYLDFNYSKRL